MVTTTDTPMMYILCSVPSHLKDSTRPSVVQDTQKQKSAFNSESLNAVASIWKFFETCVFAIELCFQFKVFFYSYPMSTCIIQDLLSKMRRKIITIDNRQNKRFIQKHFITNTRNHRVDIGNPRKLETSRPPYLDLIFYCTIERK